MKQKVLEKQTGSFKMKFDKNVISKFVIQPSVCCFGGDLLSVFNVLRYIAYYMTVSQFINLNW